MLVTRVKFHYLMDEVWGYTVGYSEAQIVWGASGEKASCSESTSTIAQVVDASVPSLPQYLSKPDNRPTLQHMKIH